MRVVLIFAAVAALFYAAGNLNRQPAAHRLLKSDDFLWKAFLQCKLTADRKISFDIAYTPEVRRMNGKEVTVSGFMVPLEAKEDFRHFLLSSRAPSCAFCPPGEPNELMEVFTAKPMKWQEEMVTLSGTLVLPDGGNKGVFFELKDAL